MRQSSHIHKKAVVNLITAFLFLSFFPSAFAASNEIQSYDQLLQAIREVRRPVTHLTKQELVRQSWTTGKLIEDHVTAHKMWAGYGEELNKKLSKDLALRANEIRDMRRFTRIYPELPAQDYLGWAHYKILIYVHDPVQRQAMRIKAEKEKWPRDKMREELKKNSGQNLRTSQKDGKPPASGTLNRYRVIRAADGSYEGQLVLDLGFGNSLSLRTFFLKRWPQESRMGRRGVSEINAFKEGDIVTSELRASSAGPHDLNHYSATVIQVLDGDTFDAVVDLGFGLTTAQRFRLKDIDAPEMDTEKGIAAKSFLVDLMTKNKGEVILKTMPQDQYGRYVAEVWIGKGKEFLNQKLIDEGQAVRD